VYENVTLYIKIWDRTAWGVTVSQVAQTSFIIAGATIVITAAIAKYEIEERRK
jgi:hypothetical protein